MPTSKAKTLVEAAFVDLPRYDIEAHDLAYDFAENEVGRFYFADSWQKHRDHYLVQLQVWLNARGRDEKLARVVEELDRLATAGLKWSDFDLADFLSLDDVRKLNQPEKPQRAKVLRSKPA